MISEMLVDAGRSLGVDAYTGEQYPYRQRRLPGRENERPDEEGKAW
jgi:hypothetical protein